MATAITAEGTANSNASIAENVTEQFIEMMNQFLEAMEEVFPECLRVKGYKLALNVELARNEGNPEGLRAFKQRAISGYHDSMAAYYARCLERDETLIREPIDLMTNIGMPAKWTSDLHPDTKEAIWEYILKLNEFANVHNMYSRVPPGMMSSIESVAHTIAAQISAGQTQLNDLNLFSVSQQVVNSINPDELRQFAQTLQSGNVMENVSSMYAMMSSMMRHQNL
jgi:hypothetical protein